MGWRRPGTGSPYNTLILPARRALGLTGYGEHYPSGMTAEGVLPDGRAVRLLSSRGYRRRAGVAGPHRHFHRIQILCSSCGKWIPIGRMHQHEGTAACYRARPRDPGKKHKQPYRDYLRAFVTFYEEHRKKGYSDARIRHLWMKEGPAWRKAHGTAGDPGRRSRRDASSELRKVSLTALGRMLRRAVKQGDDHMFDLVSREIQRRARQRRRG